MENEVALTPPLNRVRNLVNPQVPFRGKKSSYILRNWSSSLGTILRLEAMISKGVLKVDLDPCFISPYLGPWCKPTLILLWAYNIGRVVFADNYRTLGISMMLLKPLNTEDENIPTPYEKIQSKFNNFLDDIGTPISVCGYMDGIFIKLNCPCTIY